LPAVPHFGVTSRRDGGWLVVAPTGELDIAAVESVRSHVDRRGDDEGLLLDLHALDFLDTSGIQLVVEAYRASQERGFPLRIRRAREPVQRVFELAGLEGVLPFEDGPPDA
jgi:anti-sigma B factor antagonist